MICVQLIMYIFLIKTTFYHNFLPLFMLIIKVINVWPFGKLLHILQQSEVYDTNFFSCIKSFAII